MPNRSDRPEYANDDYAELRSIALRIIELSMCSDIDPDTILDDLRPMTHEPIDEF